jgi:hypothetical protein
MDELPEVPDLGEYIEKAATFSGGAKKMIAKGMIKPYTKMACAAVTAFPLALGAVATGPVPVIAHQQEPVKRPDEHIASQPQAEEAINEASNTLDAALVSVMQADLSDNVRMRPRKKTQVMMETFSPPLPLFLDRPEDPDKNL